MAQVRCRNGHYYNNEIYQECPYCPSDPNPDPDPNPSTKKPIIIKVLTALSVILALGSFVYASQASRNFNEVQQVLQKKSNELDAEKKKFEDKKLDPKTINAFYRFFNSVFGYGSEKFYTDTPILVLETGGASKDINIHCDYDQTMSFIEMDAFTNDSFNSGLAKDIKTDWVNHNIRVTPGYTKGFNIIHVFFNEELNVSFDVLVIVK